MCANQPLNMPRGLIATDMLPLLSKGKKSVKTRLLLYGQRVQLRNETFLPKGSAKADTKQSTGHVNCGGSKLLSYCSHSSQIFSITRWESRRNGDCGQAASTAAFNLHMGGRQESSKYPHDLGWAPRFVCHYLQQHDLPIPQTLPQLQAVTA